jgi:hypothetical protein
VLRFGFASANPAPAIEGIEPLGGHSNYFIGNDPAKWRTDIPHYGRVRIQELYPGIDLVLYGNPRQLEYDFVVAPGADPNQIRLSVSGAEDLRIDEAGNLVLTVAGGELVQKAPRVYQTIGEERRIVAGGYRLFADGVESGIAGVSSDPGERRHPPDESRPALGGPKDAMSCPPEALPPSQIGFQVAAYNAAEPLVIDPVMVYSTYLGGSDYDWGGGIAVDGAGNAYVTGQTDSPDFPTVNALYPNLWGGGDAFVFKLNAAGNAPVYSTYLGGSDYDWGNDIAVDSAGNAYVTGETTSPDFPTVSALYPTPGGGYVDAFVSKLNAAGSAPVYSTYLGGSGDERGNGIATDGAGNTYVTGYTYSPDFPPVNALYPNLWGDQDAFITKISSSQNSDGWVDISSGVTVPETAQIGEEFEISFILKEHRGGSKSFEEVAVAILDKSDNHLYDAQVWQDVLFAPDEAKPFTVTTHLNPNRPEGFYQAVVRGRLPGEDWFDFGVVPGSGAHNPRSFFAQSAPVPAGLVDVSHGVTVPETVEIGETINISFKLREHQGGPKTFEQIALAILDAAGSHLYDAKIWSNQTFSPYQERSFDLSTSLNPNRPEGQYYAIARGKVPGEDWFDFGVAPGTNGVNPRAFAAVSEPIDHIDYVALGDSYSSGEGTGYYDPQTDCPPAEDRTDVQAQFCPEDPGYANECRRSPFAYSTKCPGGGSGCGGNAVPAAADTDVSRELLACSGALTEHAVGYGKWSAPDDVAQIAYLGTDADLVSLTIGGNDASFAEVLKLCAFYQNCPSEPGILLEEQILEETITTQFVDKLRQTYQAILVKTEDKPLFVLGYPNILPELIPLDCDLDTQLAYDPIETAFFREVAQRLNDAIKCAAAGAGVHFVPVAGPFGGHEACGSEDEDWITALRILPADEQHESFHPNLRGHAELAKILNAFMEEKCSGSFPCQDGIPANPDPFTHSACANIPPGQSRLAWTDSMSESVPYPSLTFGGLRVDPTLPLPCYNNDYYVPGQEVRLRGSGFQADAMLDITLQADYGDYSDDLGTAVADGQGDIDTTVILTPSVPTEGSALIEVAGTAATGATHLLLGTFGLMSSLDGDTDGDATPDMCDNCPNTPSTNLSDSDSDGQGDVCGA